MLNPGVKVNNSTMDFKLQPWYLDVFFLGKPQQCFIIIIIIVIIIIIIIIIIIMETLFFKE